MHLAEGTLANYVCTATTVASATIVAGAVTRVARRIDRRRAAWAAMVTLGLVLLQSANIPLPGGSSAHILGAALAAALLGPALGIVAMALVVVVGTVVLGDGGMSALGANVWNMAVVGVGSAACVYAMVRRARTGAAGHIAALVTSSSASLAAVVAAVLLETVASGALYGGNSAAGMFSAQGTTFILDAAVTAGIVAVLATTSISIEGNAVESSR